MYWDSIDKPDTDIYQKSTVIMKAPRVLMPRYGGGTEAIPQ